MVHPLEYDETPEGRICAEAREIIIWMYRDQRKQNSHLEYPPVPDYRDFYDHLRPIIRVEMLKIQLALSEMEVLRRELSDAERDLAKERALRSNETSLGERRK